MISASAHVPWIHILLRYLSHEFSVLLSITLSGLSLINWTPAVRICIYYIHTEKYSPKSYVVNFRTQISFSQSEERTMVFTREKKMIRPIRIANDVFSRVTKMIRPIRSHRGVWVSRQNSRLLLQLAAPLRTHSMRKVLLKEFFSLKKWKTFRKWSGIVSFVSLSIKKTVESRRNNSGKG